MADKHGKAAANDNTCTLRRNMPNCSALPKAETNFQLASKQIGHVESLFPSWGSLDQSNAK